VPFVYRTQRARLGAGEVVRDAGGPGDPVALARATVLGHRAPSFRALRLALLGGVKLPLGSHDEQDDLGTLPPGLQPGTGAVDVLGGALVTLGPTARTRALGSVVYRRTTTNGDGYRLGDTLTRPAR
jgi:hypothetical protein